MKDAHAAKEHKLIKYNCEWKVKVQNSNDYNECK